MTSSPQIRPLGETLGAEALGIDLSKPFDEATSAWVVGAFAENPVLVFRDQDLGAVELAAFGRRFGTPRMHSLISTVMRTARRSPGSPMSTRTARWTGTASSAPPTGTPFHL